MKREVLQEIKLTKQILSEDAAAMEMLANIACFFVGTPIALDYCEDAIEGIKKKIENHKLKKKIKMIGKKNKVIRKITGTDSSFTDSGITPAATKEMVDQLRSELSGEEFEELKGLVA